MIRGARLAIAALFVATPLAADYDPAGAAEAALADLDTAIVSLDAAEDAGDRILALSRTIQAVEAGLTAMRESLRQATLRERTLTATLVVEDDRITALLAALQTFGRHGSPDVLLHPEGALGTVRAGMMLAEMSSTLDNAARDVRQDLADVRALRILQAAATDRMEVARDSLVAARTDLNAAMAARSDLPMRFTADPVRAAILIASTETLEGFAAGLSMIVEEERAPPLALMRPDGDLTLPVAGRVVRQADETDAAGVTRPGVIVAAPPGALVTTPTAATLRYVGPLLDLGRVVILEPRADTLVVLAGLATTYGRAGQIIDAGTPVGMMGGSDDTSPESPSPSGDRSGTDLSERLYIEIREDNRPIDPGLWFDLGPGT